MEAVRTPWTEEDDARLRQLVSEHLSYSQIGELIGRNKNQCIGRAHRLGIHNRDTKPVTKRQVAKAVAKAVDTLFKAPMPEPAQDNRPRPRYEQPEAATTAFGVARPLMKLKANHCRWPTHEVDGKHWFCCADRESLTSPYCTEHRLIAWRPTQRQLTTKAYR